MKSNSRGEKASFLVRWATELYGPWATGMNKVLPGCKTCLKTSTLRIVSKIEEVEDQEGLGDGWEKIYDLLRASYTCASPQHVL